MFVVLYLMARYIVDRYAREEHAVRSRDSINIEIFAQKDHIITMINTICTIFFSRLSIFHLEENKLHV